MQSVFLQDINDMAAKPLGFYGLDLSDRLDRELNALDGKPLLELLNDLTASLRLQIDFVCYPLSGESDEEIQALSTFGKFALIRWTVGAIEAKLMEAAK